MNSYKGQLGDITEIENQPRLKKFNLNLIILTCNIYNNLREIYMLVSMIASVAGLNTRNSVLLMVWTLFTYSINKFISWPFIYLFLN